MGCSFCLASEITRRDRCTPEKLELQDFQISHPMRKLIWCEIYFGRSVLIVFSGGNRLPLLLIQAPLAQKRLLHRARSFPCAWLSPTRLSAGKIYNFYPSKEGRDCARKGIAPRGVFQGS
jgi:hypothetical protein